MSEKISLKLESTSILAFPFQAYAKDFCFYVNGKEFITSKIIADILSPAISKMHANDPTVDSFEIKTQTKGDFAQFLNLINFKSHFFTEEEIEYFTEIIQILQTNSITIQDPNKSPISMNNVFKRIQKHEKNDTVFSQQFSDEIDFISSHFFEINEKQEKELQKLKDDTIDRIIGNRKLQLKSEDQLLSFINQLYIVNTSFSHLYEYVQFKNISTAKIIEFLNIFNIDDISNKTWNSISNRLRKSIIDASDEFNQNKRYYKSGIPVLLKEKNEFNGILQYLQNHSNDQKNLFEISSSSIMNNDNSRSPSNVVLFDDRKNIFTSENVENSWICFDFGKRKVVPLNYSIRSCSSVKSCANLKSWIVEGSNDNYNWLILDKQINSQLLNGSSMVQSFNVNNFNFLEFRFLRLRQTDLNWYDNSRLYIDSMEFFGYLI